MYVSVKKPRIAAPCSPKHNTSEIYSVHPADVVQSMLMGAEACDNPNNSRII